MCDSDVVNPKKGYMKIVLTSLFVGMAFTVFAQSEYLKFTDYTLAQPLINPSVMGVESGVSGLMLYQSCFEKTDFRPTLGAFNVNSSIQDKGLGGGITVIYDKYGPYQKMAAYLAGSYRLKVNEGKYLFFGLQAGVNYVSNDPSKYVLHDPSETLLMEKINLTQPNFGFGLHYKADKYYVGFSIPEFMYNYVNNEGNKESGLISERLRLYLYGGYKFSLGKNTLLEPYAYLTYSESDDMKMDLGARLWYKESFAVGLQYRTKEAVGVMARVKLFDELWLGYAFENNSEAAPNFNSRQEISLSFRFGKKSQKSSPSEAVEKFDDINSIRYF